MAIFQRRWTFRNEGVFSLGPLRQSSLCRPLGVCGSLCGCKCQKDISGWLRPTGLPGLCLPAADSICRDPSVFSSVILGSETSKLKQVPCQFFSRRWKATCTAELGSARLLQQGSAFGLWPKRDREPVGQVVLSGLTVTSPAGADHRPLRPERVLWSKVDVGEAELMRFFSKPEPQTKGLRCLSRKDMTPLEGSWAACRDAVLSWECGASTIARFNKYFRWCIQTSLAP